MGATDSRINLDRKGNKPACASPRGRLVGLSSANSTCWKLRPTEIIQDGSTYYWIGENKLDGSSFQSINCYSSTVCEDQLILSNGAGLTWSKDLVQWTFVNELLTLQSSGDLGPSRVVERPHIIYNSATSKFVMWLHIDSSSYGEAKAGVATSSTVCGDYTYL